MEIIIKGTTKKVIFTNDKIKIRKREILHEDVKEIKYQLGSWTQNGFITFVVDDKDRLVNTLNNSIWNKHSVRFWFTQNEKVKEILNYFDGKIPITDVKLMEQQLKEAEVIYCPRCLSTNIEGKHKGYSAAKGTAGMLLMGRIGLMLGATSANDIKARCNDCGHKWVEKQG